MNKTTIVSSFVLNLLLRARKAAKAARGSVLSQAERKVIQGQADLWDRVSDAAAATLLTNCLVLQRAERLGIVLTAECWGSREGAS